MNTLKAKHVRKKGQVNHVEVYIDDNHYVIGRIFAFHDGYFFQADTSAAHFFTNEELAEIFRLVQEHEEKKTLG